MKILSNTTFCDVSYLEADVTCPLCEKSCGRTDFGFISSNGFSISMICGNCGKSYDIKIFVNFDAVVQI